MVVPIDIVAIVPTRYQESEKGRERKLQHKTN
jgi:hypothetical protein